MLDAGGRLGVASEGMSGTPAAEPPLTLVAEAERFLLARRRGPPMVGEAVAIAMAAAAGAPLEPGSGFGKAARGIAAAVERHGAAFEQGNEPAYHDRHHQAEATLAMGWLCGAARRLGLIGEEAAMFGVLAMAAHDLLHDGGAGMAPGEMEARSAEEAAGIAAASGLPAEGIATIRRVILATRWPWEAVEEPDALLCRMAREADLFASTTPRLGWELGRLLEAELRQSGLPDPKRVGTHGGRLHLLRQLPDPTAPAAAMGLDRARDAQIAAYALCAQRRGAGETPEQGAAALDAMEETAALALYGEALAEAGLRS